MTDYSIAIEALIAVSLVLTGLVAYVLRQPSDLPSLRKEN
mgnify:FL=1|jgi:hypothetical protein|tara:strand:+ start:579 stop:698 length:120 start_codon:yes stop_codon:yes gene_type:complete